MDHGKSSRFKPLLVVCFALGGLLLSAEPLAVAGSRIDLASLQHQQYHDRFIVKYRKDSPARLSQTALQKSLDNAALGTPVTHGNLGIQHLRRISTQADVIRTSRKLDRTQAATLMRQLALDPSVEYVEVDRILQPLSVPNDPRYAEQWHYFESTGGINLPDAWNSATGVGVVVAVVDTGITSHPDLDANILLGGYDFISDSAIANDGDGRDADPHDPGDWQKSDPPEEPCDPDMFCDPSAMSDSSWHGTHVAGTIAAVTNNATGTAGVAFQAKVVPVRVLGSGGGYMSDVADGIIWAAGGTVTGVPANAHPAEVINLSLGGSGACSTSLQSAIDTANTFGATVVAAAGNSNANVSNTNPANCNNVIAVAANDRQGGRTYYSNYGSLVDLAAPGGETSGSTTDGNGVLSTWNTGTTSPGQSSYAFYEGTSMAAPHVAGVIALMQSASTVPMTPAEIETILKSTARAFPSAPTQPTGAGIVDAKAAVDAVIQPLNLYSIYKQGDSGKTEIHTLNGADSFQTFLLHKATGLGQTGTDSSWAFDLGDYNRDGVTDLYVIKKQGVSATEVHVLNGADNFQTFLINKATGLGQTGTDSSWAFNLGDYNRDSIIDLYAIKKQGVSTTEVHVLNGADNFQTFLHHSTTALGKTGTDDSWVFDLGDYNLDGVADLYAIKKQGASTTEVHILNGADNFQTYLLHSTTGLGKTGTDNSWVFKLGKYNRDSVVDLFAIKKQGTSTTEVHILNGADNFQTYLLHSTTALGKTGTNHVWEFIIGLP